MTVDPGQDTPQCGCGAKRAAPSNWHTVDSHWCRYHPHSRCYVCAEMARMMRQQLEIWLQQGGHDG